MRLFFTHILITVLLTSGCSMGVENSSESRRSDSLPQDPTTAAQDNHLVAAQLQSQLINTRPRIAATANTIAQRLKTRDFDSDLQLLFDRLKSRAHWILANPTYSIGYQHQQGDPAVFRERFNPRRCMRVVTDSLSAVKLASGLNLSKETLIALYDRAVGEIEVAAAQSVAGNQSAGYKWINATELEKAEATACLAVGYDWLAGTEVPALADNQSSRQERRLTVLQAARSAIYVGLRSFINNADFSSARCSLAALASDSTSVACKSNWNAIVSSAALLGAAVVDNDVANDSNNVDVIAAARERAALTLPVFYTLFSADGAYAESPAYLNYALEFLALADSAVISRGWPTLPLFSTGVKNSGDFLLDMISPISPAFAAEPKNDTVIAANFGDSATTVSPSLPVLAWQARRLRHKQTMSAAIKLARAPMTIGTSKTLGTLNSPSYGTMDALAIFWYVPKSESFIPRSTNRVYGDGQSENSFAMLYKEASNGVKLYGILKGGRPDATGHGHMDSGDFTLEALGRRWSANIGLDQYSPDYFNPVTRWDFLRTNNFGHNTIVINNSRPAADVASRVQFAAGHGASVSTATIDLSTAYHSGAGAPRRSITRTLSLNDSGAFVIHDRITRTSNNTVVQWRMVYCPQNQHVFAPSAACQPINPVMRTGNQSAKIIDSSCADATSLEMRILSPSPYTKTIQTPNGPLEVSLPKFDITPMQSLPNEAPTRYSNPLPACQIITVTEQATSAMNGEPEPSNRFLDIIIELKPKRPSDEQQ